MQKLFMDCSFSAYFKGKGTFIVSCISHYRMYWHTPYWVSGVCVWAWGFEEIWGRGSVVEIYRKPEISLRLNFGCLQPPPDRQGKAPPEQSLSKLELSGWSPHLPLPWGQLCARPEAELNSKQYSARFCWPAAKPTRYCHCQPEITGFLWTHPFQPQERSGLVLVCLEIKQEGATAGFSYSLALCSCVV